MGSSDLDSVHYTNVSYNRFYRNNIILMPKRIKKPNQSGVVEPTVSRMHSPSTGKFWSEDRCYHGYRYPIQEE